MASVKLINLFAVCTLAALVCFFSATPTNALSTNRIHSARGITRGHDVIAREKRGSAPSKRCKPRSSSLAAIPSQPAKSSVAASHATSSSTHHPAASHAASSTPHPVASHAASSSAPQSTNTPAKVGSSGSGSCTSKIGVAWPNGNDPSLKFYAPGHGGKACWLVYS